MQDDGKQAQLAGLPRTAPVGAMARDVPSTAMSCVAVRKMSIVASTVMDQMSNLASYRHAPSRARAAQTTP